MEAHRLPKGLEIVQMCCERIPRDNQQGPFQMFLPASSRNPCQAGLGSVGLDIFNETSTMQVHQFRHLQLGLTMSIGAIDTEWANPPS